MCSGAEVGIGSGVKGDWCFAVADGDMCGGD